MLREKIAKAIRWEFSTAGPHKVEPLIDAILAIPEIRDALQEMEGLDDRLADAREDGWRACEESRD